MKTVYIVFDVEWNEYQVTAKGAPARQTYHTDDRQDAIDTARAEHGADCKIIHRRKKAD